MEHDFAAMLFESRRRAERARRIRLALKIAMILLIFLALTTAIALYKYFHLLSFDTILPVFTSSVYKIFINPKSFPNDFCIGNPYIEQYQNTFLSQFNSHNPNHLQDSAIFISEYWLRFRYISIHILSAIFDIKEAHKVYFEIKFI